MPRRNQLATWTIRALIAAGVALPAGLVLALDHPHPDGEDQKKESRVLVRTDKGDNVRLEKKHRAHGSWTDGDVEVTTTVEDGHVKVIVNGDVVYDGDLTGISDLDLGEIKLQKLNGAFALLKDGDQVMHLGHGGPLIIGDKEIALEHLKNLRIEGLDAIKELRHLNFEGGDWSFEFDNEHLKKFIERSRDGNTWAFDFDNEDIKKLIEQAQEGGATAFFSSDDDDHPPVMLGINIGQGDEVVSKLKTLDLDENEVTVVMRAIEGLPAAKSGIKGGDIIIELEGSKSAGHDALTEVLRGKAVGETIDLKVLRDGEPERIVVELEPFDGEALGVQVAPRGFNLSTDQLRFAPQWRSLSFDHEELSELSAKIAKLAAEMAESTKGEREAMAGKMEQLTKQLTEMATSGAGNFSFGGDGANVWRFSDDDGDALKWQFSDGKGNVRKFSLPRIEIDEDQRGLVIVRPDEEVNVEVESSHNGDNQKRIRELEAKIKRLERLLEQRERERHNDGDV